MFVVPAPDTRGLMRRASVSIAEIPSTACHAKLVGSKSTRIRQSKVLLLLVVEEEQDEESMT